MVHMIATNSINKRTRMTFPTFAQSEGDINGTELLSISATKTRAGDTCSPLTLVNLRKIHYYMVKKKAATTG